MATAIAGRMKAILGLDRRSFTAGIKGARSEISAFAGKIRGYAGVISAALGAAGAGSFATLGLSAVTSAGELAKLSAVANTTPEEFQKLALAAQSVGVEQDKLSDILKDVNDRVGEFLSTGGGQMKDFFDNIAPKVGVTAKQFQGLSGPQALQLYVSSLEKAGASQQDFTFYMEALSDEATALVPLLRNGGSGLAEYSQKARSLGAIMDNDTVASFHRAQVAMSQVQLVFTGFRNILAQQIVPGLVGLSNAFTEAAEEGQPLGTLIRGFAAELPRLAAYVGAAAAAFLVWRTALVLTRVAMLGLRSAMIASGVGIVVVAVGEAAYRFSELVSATGSFSQAIGLLKAVAVEAFGRLGLLAESLEARGYAAWKKLEAAGLEVFASVVEGGIWFANRYIGIYRGAFAAVTAIWGKLPAALGDFVYSAANGAVQGIETMINAVVGRINTLIDGINGALSHLPDWVTGGEDVQIGSVSTVDFGEIANPFSGAMEDAGKAAAAAFQKGLSTDTFSGSGVAGALKGAADEARGVAAAGDLAADSLKGLALSPMQSLTALRTALGKVGDKGSDLGGAGSPLGKGLGQIAQGAGKATKVLEKLRAKYAELKATFGMTDLQAQIWKDQRDAKVSATSKTGQEIAQTDTLIAGMQDLKSATDSWRDSIKDSFKSFLKGSTSFLDMLGQIASKLADMLMDKAFDSLFSSVGGTTLLSGILSSFGIGANANGTDNWSGGLTWINERGGELANLPNGTQIIPHDVSMRMAASASDASSGTSVQVVPSPLFDVRVSQISNASAARMGSALNGALPQRVAQITSKPRRKG